MLDKFTSLMYSEIQWFMFEDGYSTIDSRVFENLSICAMPVQERSLYGYIGNNRIEIDLVIHHVVMLNSLKKCCYA
jgi:hypothetical protein